MPVDQPWFFIPEFIALFIGTFACWFLAIGYTLWNLRKSRREQLRCIHENLQQIDLAWSTNETQIKAASDVDFSRENQREQKWLLLAGVVLSVASWLGFFILSVLIISLEYLAKPRLERALFSSELAQTLLPPEAVRKLVERIKSE